MKWLDAKTHPIPQDQYFIAYIDLRFHSDPNEYTKELIQLFVTVGDIRIDFADHLNTTYGEPLYYSIEEVLEAHSNSIEILHVLQPIGVCMASSKEYDPPPIKIEDQEKN